MPYTKNPLENLEVYIHNKTHMNYFNNEEELENVWILLMFILFLQKSDFWLVNFLHQLLTYNIMDVLSFNFWMEHKFVKLIIGLYTHLNLVII